MLHKGLLRKLRNRKKKGTIARMKVRKRETGVVDKRLRLKKEYLVQLKVKYLYRTLKLKGKRVNTYQSLGIKPT